MNIVYRRTNGKEERHRENEVDEEKLIRDRWGNEGRVRE
jgi:hypothetical protein